MSNTQQCDPYENVVAERINETLKYEFGLKRNSGYYTIIRSASCKTVVFTILEIPFASPSM